MKSQKQILIVEDNASLALAIAAILASEKSYQTHLAQNIHEAKTVFNEYPIDLIIQDRMLPDGDGIGFVRFAKENRPDVKAIFLSVKNLSIDRVQGLKSGGDDYLAKPFDSEELLLRIEKQLQDSASYKQIKQYTFDDNQLNFQTKIATNFKGETRILSQKEMEIMEYLINHADQVIKREDFFLHVWGFTYNHKSRTIDNFIVKLRKFFERNPKNPKHFISKRLGGYIFIP